MLTVMTLTMSTVIYGNSSNNKSLDYETNINIIEIPINNLNNDRKNERSTTNSVSAFYYLLESEVEVSCFNIGITNVTLYGPMGIPVDTYTFDSNSEPMVVLSVPSDSGTYRIVIDADKYSGEGEFEVR